MSRAANSRARSRATVAPTADAAVHDADELLSLLREAPAAVARISRTKRPDASTLWRWHTRGRQGVRLRAIVVGRERFTTRAWLLDFFSALADAQQAELEKAQRARA